MPRYGQKRTRYPSYPRMPAAGERARATRFRGATAFPRGPKLYDVYGVKEQMVAWGPPPPGFVTGTTSKSEWAAYWCAFKVAKSIWGINKDPRDPPFIGIPPYFSYQIPFLGGRTIRGGAIADMQFDMNGLLIIVRIVTNRYHIETTSQKLVSDENQYRALTNVHRMQIVVDILEGDIITDKTGQAGIRAFWRALMGHTSKNPALTGTARRVVPV